MPYSSKSGTGQIRRLYNKWRLATLALNCLGLMLFLFALGLEDLTKPLLVVSVVVLWAGVVVSYLYLKSVTGKPMEGMAKFSYYISMALALVLSVLATITIIH